MLLPKADMKVCMVPRGWLGRCIHVGVDIFNTCMKDGTTAVHAATESEHEGMYGPKRVVWLMYTCRSGYIQYLYERWHHRCTCCY